MTTLAPEISVSQWFNTPESPTLKSLRGRPILLHTFQMLCPGCILHAIPLIQNVQRVFGKTDLAILGLHTVFEHHAAMKPVSLQAFIHEFKINYPVGVDEAGDPGPMPITMETYRLRGTPSTVLINRKGEMAASSFGHLDEMTLGATLQSLISESQE